MTNSISTRKTTLIKLHHSTYITSTTHFRKVTSLELPLTSLQCGQLLQSLTNSKSLLKGQQLHAHMITSGTLLRNTYLSTKVASLYANCGLMTNAQVVFDGIVNKNSFLWNSMVRGYACSGELPIKALSLYLELLSSGEKADNFTYPFVLKACGEILGVGIGRTVHGHVVVSGFESDIYVGNSLLSMYSKFADMALVRKLFAGMPERDLTSWNTVISGYVKNRKPKEGLDTFYLMMGNGLSADCVTLLGLLAACSDLVAVKQEKEIHGYIIRNGYKLCSDLLKLNNSLIEMYCKCNSMVNARRLYEEMSTKDIVSWNSLIAGYARNEDSFESLRIFCRMVLEKAKPDQVTYIAVLEACHQITALQFGMSLHSCLTKNGLYAIPSVRTALIDMYAKCGSLPCSHLVFDEMPEKNLVAWTALISGFGVHGRGEDAVSFFHEMLRMNIIPDEAAITAVLSACSHSKLVVQGKEIFYRVMKEYNMKPTVNHYSCLVDLLGRAGELDEAYDLIKNMNVNSTNDMWMALLNACRLHKNVELAEVSAQKLFEMNVQVGSYICLSNIYAAEKRWEDVERVRASMRQRRLVKPPGCSFVEVDKTVHRFLVGDKSHPQIKGIYAKLNELNEELKRAGYKADTSSVLYNVDEGVKEKMVWDHSEKLAIAFGLMKTSSGTVIRITKNLRVCEDCHTVTKLISKLMCRQIIMRDIRRFHHFRDGFCSCGDFW